MAKIRTLIIKIITYPDRPNLLGRDGIEEHPKTWDKLFAQRHCELSDWAEIPRMITEIYCYPNNYHAG
jgi:hypothetical protein